MVLRDFSINRSFLIGLQHTCGMAVDVWGHHVVLLVCASVFPELVGFHSNKRAQRLEKPSLPTALSHHEKYEEDPYDGSEGSDGSDGGGANDE